MNDIIPAILAHNEETFRERLAIAEKLAPVVHIDVMDGHFVPNSTWFDPTVINSIKTSARFELHLMVSDPTAYIGAAQDIKAISRYIWHIEVAIGHDVLINWCHKMKTEAGIAISPETPIGRLAPFVPELDEILLMGINPGFSGQSMIESTIDKVKEIHERWPDKVLGFDGGIQSKKISVLREAGIQRFCAASAIFDEKDPVKALKKLQGA